jgi:hypothetical protein
MFKNILIWYIFLIKPTENYSKSYRASLTYILLGNILSQHKVILKLF